MSRGGVNLGMLGVGGFLALAGAASISMALWLTTDAYHTVLFTGFGVAAIVGAAILAWRAVVTP